MNRNGTGATTPRPSEMALGARYPAVAACAIVSQIRRLVAEELRDGKARYGSVLCPCGASNERARR